MWKCISKWRGGNIQRVLTMMKDGGSAQIKNYKGSPNNRGIVGFWCHSWQVLTRFLKTSNFWVCSLSSNRILLPILSILPQISPNTLPKPLLQRFGSIRSRCTRHSDREQIIALLYSTLGRSTNMPLLYRGIPFSEPNTISLLQPVTGCVCQMAELSDGALCWGLPRRSHLSWTLHTE